MAEGYRDSDLPESFQGVQGPSETAKEAFQDSLKKAQAAAKKVRIQEGKARTYDSTLAQLVTRLLQEKKEDHLVLIIIQLVDLNIPSDLILAILSLEFQEAYERAEKIAKSSADIPQKEGLIPHSTQLATISGKEQQIVSEWMKRIMLNAFKDSQQVLETVIHTETWQIQPALIALFATLLERFLEKSKVENNSDSNYAFAGDFFAQMLDQLQSHIS